MLYMRVISSQKSSDDCPKVDQSRHDVDPCVRGLDPRGSMNRLNRLFEIESNHYAADDGSDFWQDFTPAMRRFRLVNLRIFPRPSQLLLRYDNAWR